MFVAGFMRGFVGFGGALVIIPILSLLIGPLAAIPVAAISGLPSVVQLLPAAIRESERGFVLPIAVATWCAAPLGAWFLVSTDPAVMKIVIAALVLTMVGLLAKGWKISASVPIAAAAGAGAGLIQGAAGVGGPPIVAVALARPGPPRTQRGNVVAAVTAITLSAMLPMWFHDLFTEDVVITGIILTPLYSLGTWLGSRYFSRGGEGYFRIAALATLATIGGVTLVLSTHGYLSTL